MPELAYFPASIGTGLALQKICGLDEEGARVGREVLSHYQVLMINLRTLYRNYHASHSATERDAITKEQGVQDLNRDIRVATEVANDVTGGRTHVLLYSNGYNSILKRYPYAKIKEPNTFLQKQYADFENQTIEALYEQRDAYGLEISLGDLTLPQLPSATNVLLLTHFPVDLLHGHDWETFDLLESHTGSIKSKLQWNTKLGIAEEHRERIPFNKMTWQLFGDKGSMISPQDIRLRKALIDVAEKYRWNTATTQNRIEFSLKEYGDPVLRGEMLKLLRT